MKKYAYKVWLVYFLFQLAKNLYTSKIEKERPVTKDFFNDEQEGIAQQLYAMYCGWC